ncbi:MAG: alpha/beta hydrolase [Pseudomonadota bacterium]
MRSRQFDVSGRQLSALVWGQPGATPVLALHGWLDNAASFIPLGQRLHEVELVALDMAGHGHSDHRGPDGEYNVWSDLPDIEAVLDQLNWSQCTLLGHSRGAIIATLYACSRPQRVQRLALLDGLQPPPVDISETPVQFAQYLDDKKRLQDRPARVFDSVEEALAVRRRFGLGDEEVRGIVERNLAKVDDGWRWRFDQRLQGASAMKLSAAHSEAILAGISIPGLLLLARDGLGRLNSLPALPNGMRSVFVEGSHHCHIDDAVDEVAQLLMDFFQEEDDRR